MPLSLQSITEPASHAQIYICIHDPSERLDHTQTHTAHIHTIHNIHSTSSRGGPTQPSLGPKLCLSASPLRTGPYPCPHGVFANRWGGSTERSSSPTENGPRITTDIMIIPPRSTEGFQSRKTTESESRETGRDKHVARWGPRFGGAVS
ncbi:hypothetical protein VTK73DRAFT_2394 [Phialemonium thermophilum]|uniref:Uncharacterized protein n=1 Tax=Phialemonium thermophilum TaxID=223376 RepID=A0ABR3VS74_9PEZI